LFNSFLTDIYLGKDGLIGETFDDGAPSDRRRTIAAALAEDLVYHRLAFGSGDGLV
jgi:hypothetical protein